MIIRSTKLSPDKLKEIDDSLEDFYVKSIQAGNQMVAAGLKTSQVRGLETLITSASRFSEIINYVKRQTGKDRKNTWLQVGSLLLEQLEELEKQANSLGEGNTDAILDIKLRLARGWAKQVVAHYLYSAAHK